MQKSIAIIGAGISGMATAYLLLKKGYRLTIYASAFYPNITSNKAAAFWFPYHIRNDKRGIAWCLESYRQYKVLSTDKNTGISMCKLIKVLRAGVSEEEPAWIDFMPRDSYKMLPQNELADGIARICEATVPLIETQLFLPWLQQQLLKAGVVFFEKEIKDLYALAKKHDVVINCSGLGAQQLCNDDTLVPVRGQVALLSPGGSNDIYLDNEASLYVVPRKDAIIVGGTYEEGIADAVNEPETIQQIVDKAYTAVPALKAQVVTGSWAGIRPYRETVRVEQEPGTNIIHNYGHGGSGYTLAFGCAASVASLIA
jgi:D-amino-acid oxidase